MAISASRSLRLRHSTPARSTGAAWGTTGDGGGGLSSVAGGISEALVATAAGLLVAGMIQHDERRPNRRRCDMSLVDLATGRRIDLGAFGITNAQAFARLMQTSLKQTGEKHP